MRFADALVEERTETRRCKLAATVDSLTSEDRQAFEDAVGTVSQTSIHRALRRLGCDISYASLHRHVSGDCVCRG